MAGIPMVRRLSIPAPPIRRTREPGRHRLPSRHPDARPGHPMTPEAQLSTDAAVPPPAGSLWSGVRDAIRGTNADYTKIPLRRAVFLLAVPMVLELVLESTFAVADIFFVAKLGSSAVATVGLTETFLFFLYSIAMGLAMAVTAVVARRVGEDKREEAAISAVQAIWIALLASVPFAIVGIVWARELLALM